MQGQGRHPHGLEPSGGTAGGAADAAVLPVVLCGAAASANRHRKGEGKTREGPAVAPHRHSKEFISSCAVSTCCANWCTMQGDGTDTRCSCSCLCCFCFCLPYCVLRALFHHPASPSSVGRPMAQLCTDMIHRAGCCRLPTATGTPTGRHHLINPGGLQVHLPLLLTGRAPFSQAGTSTWRSCSSSSSSRALQLAATARAAQLLIRARPAATAAAAWVSRRGCMAVARARRRPLQQRSSSVGALAGTRGPLRMVMRRSSVCFCGDGCIVCVRYDIHVQPWVCG